MSPLAIILLVGSIDAAALGNSVVAAFALAAASLAEGLRLSIGTTAPPRDEFDFSDE